MAGLTQEQADLLYAALSHLHDHGAMNGLDDDDHPQYLTEERGDDRYSQVNHGHNKYSAVLTSTLDLTTVYQDVPGLSISLPAGHWSVMACLDVRPGLAGVSALGQLLVGSTAQSRVIVVRAEGTTFWATVGQCWDIVLTETTTIKIQARCSAVTSPVSQIQYHSSLIVW